MRHLKYQILKNIAMFRISIIHLFNFRRLFLIISSLLLTLQLSSQTCPITNPYADGSTNGVIINDIAQSFEMSLMGVACPNGEITGFTIFSLSNNSNVSLTVYEGEGFGGNILHTQNNISLLAGSPENQAITLSTPLPYIGGQSYTFRLTSDNTFQLAKSTLLNPYQSGQLYENGSVIINEDLFFLVNTAEAALLPVELSYFSAEENDGEVLLEWQTESEQNNEGFYVESSQNGHDWFSLDFVSGQGDSYRIHDYKYIDSPSLNKVYYRLKQVDYDGKIEYSPIVFVEIKNTTAPLDISIFPNPIKTGETLTISSNDKQLEVLYAVNALGQTVWRKNIKNISELSIHAAEFPGEGWYILIFQGRDTKATHKLYVQN